MKKCFRCQKETAKPNEAYYRLKRLGEQAFSDYCCQNCWNNHKQEILKADKNIISVSGEQDDLHQIVYTQPKCSTCNEYKKAVCQCDTERERERRKPDWTGYKCLKCGKQETNIPEVGCPSCQSRNLEVSLASPFSTHGFGDTHFTLHECPQCHLFKDITYHILTGQRAKDAKQIAINNWKLNNEYCTNSTHQLSDKPNQQETKPFNWKSPWVIGTGMVLVGGMVGLVIYLTNKKNKE